MKGLLLTLGALSAFALNSILCRAALASHSIDPASFTALRLASGALVLSLMVGVRRRGPERAGSVWAALALFTYAAGFSFAYVRLHAGLGALILFGAVQVTMIGWDIIGGRRLTLREGAGLLLAALGLGTLALPGATDTYPGAALLMGLAGGAWGIYSVLGKRQAHFLRATAANFSKSLVLVPLLFLASGGQWQLSATGFTLAVISGAVTSGLGYVVWYAALPLLSATQASISQLSVPVLTAGLGVLLLGETISLRLGLCSLAILAGVALALVRRRATVT